MSVNECEGEKGRGVTWRSDEVERLVAKWAEQSMQEKINNKIYRNKDVYSLIAASIPGRDWDACYKKIQQLTRKYRNYKDSLRQTGGGEAEIPSSLMDVYEIMDEVLHDRELTTPTVLLSMDQGSQSSSSDTIPQEGRPRKRKSSGNGDEIRAMMEHAQSRADERLQALIEYQREERQREREHDIQVLQLLLGQQITVVSNEDHDDNHNPVTE